MDPEPGERSSTAPSPQALGVQTLRGLEIRVFLQKDASGPPVIKAAASLLVWGHGHMVTEPSHGKLIKLQQSGALLLETLS